MVDQGDDQSREWILQRRGRVTASSFGEITKAKSRARHIGHLTFVQQITYEKAIKLAMIMNKELVICIYNTSKNIIMTAQQYKRQVFISTIRYASASINTIFKQLLIVYHLSCRPIGWVHHLMG